ncbi:MAG: TetR/AcrR family transcriptional regulator [Solirubrobacteraceae bacterium]
MAGQEETGLPASIEAAWGRHERPSKGPKPGLTLQRIVDAAIRVAGTEGLAAVSMARVAQELGASTMSLYRYLGAKDELLALMVDAALGPPRAPDPDEEWRAGLTRWAWGYHHRVREHPWALRVPITGPPTTPNQVRWLEDGLRSLRNTGLAEDQKASVVLLLSGYLRSEATLTAELTAAQAITDAAMAGYANLLATHTDPAHFPAIHSLLAAGVFDVADDPDDEFTFGLERILDGIQALVQARSQACT